MMQVEALGCTICGAQITGGYMYGDGDGSGRRFAHPRCWHLRVLDGTDGANRARALRWLDFETRIGLLKILRRPRP